MCTRNPVRLALVVGILSTVSGCSGQPSLPTLFPQLGKPAEEKPPEAKAEPQEPPACKGAEKCAAHLKKLVANPKREWIGKRQSPAAYSDGTRLFAYRVLKGKLTCAELARALQETREAAPTLQGGEHAGTRKLMAQVSAELRAERQQRCKPAGKS